MSFPSLQLTDAGRQIIIKALSGDCAVVFTKFGVGNGDAPTDVNALTDLVNSVKSISINAITSGDGCANLTGTLDNANLETGFWWSEIGIFATDPDDGEVLYAYAHAGEYAEYIPAYSNQSYLRTMLNVTVVVGDAENVTAVIGEYAGYVTQEDFAEHTENTNNPHGVTKAQVGLGNVPNVPTNDQTPTFSEASSISTINSGEKLSAIMGKIKKAISSLISHFNASNPHNITCSKIGAATSRHTHDASSITSGILSPVRGGTGVASIASLWAALWSGRNATLDNSKALSGKDTNGTSISLIKINDSDEIVIGSDSASGGVHIHGGKGMICLSNTDGTTRRYFRISSTGVPYSADQVDFGYSTNRWNTVYCSSVNNSSDLKLKENIEDIDTAAAIIRGLKPIRYNRKGSTRVSFGFGAQDVYKLLHRLNIKNAEIYDAGKIVRNNDEEGMSCLPDDVIDRTSDEKLAWGLDYSQLIAPLIAFVQEQDRRINELENELKTKEE